MGKQEERPKTRSHRKVQSGYCLSKQATKQTQHGAANSGANTTNSGNPPMQRERERSYSTSYPPPTNTNRTTNKTKIKRTVESRPHTDLIPSAPPWSALGSASGVSAWEKHDGTPGDVPSATAAAHIGWQVLRDALCGPVSRLRPREPPQAPAAPGKGFRGPGPSLERDPGLSGKPVGHTEWGPLPNRTVFVFEAPAFTKHKTKIQFCVTL